MAGGYVPVHGGTRREMYGSGRGYGRSRTGGPTYIRSDGRVSSSAESSESESETEGNTLTPATTVMGGLRESTRTSVHAVVYYVLMLVFFIVLIMLAAALGQECRDIRDLALRAADNNNIPRSIIKTDSHDFAGTTLLEDQLYATYDYATTTRNIMYYFIIGAVSLMAILKTAQLSLAKSPTAHWVTQLPFMLLLACVVILFSGVAAYMGKYAFGGPTSYSAMVSSRPTKRNMGTWILNAAVGGGIVALLLWLLDGFILYMALMASNRTMVRRYEVRPVDNNAPKRPPAYGARR